MKKREESLRDLWYTIKQINICIIQVPEGAVSLCGIIMAEHFPNLRKEMEYKLKTLNELQLE